ncbi:MAG: GAF domain-containing sensor histidine kinase [Candidatus Riflebacteria bacterium]|nr:GAF domain-containing sensor histidine kinase [Candidatus Riflebacteria bacterium]
MTDQKSANDTCEPAQASDLRGRIEQLSKLLDVAKRMSHERDLDKLLTFIAEQVTAGLNADRCAIFLVDEKTDEIWSRVALGEVSEIRFRKGQGIAGTVIATGESINIPDAYADPRFNRKVDEDTGYRTRSLMCVPLQDVDGRIIGAFEVLNKQNGEFTRSDHDYLIAFGSQAAVAIESAKLYAELQSKMNQLNILYQLERELSTTSDFDSFMMGVIKRAAGALGASGGSILLLDEQSKRIYFTYPTGEKADSLKTLFMEGDEGIAGHVVKTGQKVLDNNVQRNPLHSTRISEELGLETQSIVAVPLVVREGDVEKTIGALEIINRLVGRFTPADLQVADIIAAQVSSAISRKRLLEEKRKSERLATVGTLASSIIHDFKNPMAIIRGYGELIQRMELPPEKRELFCKIIVGEVDRCVNMTKEMLYFVRGEKNFAFELVPAPSLVDEIALLLDNEMSRSKIEFMKVVQYEGPIRVDREKLKRVIFNLSNNALAAMKDGGVFGLECRRVEGEVEFRISDTGPGIAPEIRPKLFNAFATFGKKEGTGLGLCIAKEIIEGHGGRIYLDDKVPRGACFVIRLRVPEE